jgi:light-regulated signal transduction histidine kinase (bacteriophytochrome)
MRRDPLDLSAIARSIAVDLETRDSGRGVVFSIEDGLTAIGDASLLRAALLNLLENAWKFTRRQEKPCIEFGAVPEADRRVFYVRDNGAGFDPALADKLFFPFHRLHPSSEFEGTGIGLATAERIIRRHGGRIWAEGELGRGATFHFTLQGDG